MEKRMEPVIVKTSSDGTILIEQDDPSREDPCVIILMPEQVDTIVQWLQEAKAELKK